MGLTSSEDYMENLFNIVSCFFSTKEEVQEECKRIALFLKENIPLDIAAFKISSKEELEV